MNRLLARGRRMVSALMLATLSPMLLLAAPAPAGKAAPTTSFNPVTDLLNTGGQFYSYQSTEDLLEKLPGKLQLLRTLILSEMNRESREYQQTQAVLNLLTHMLRSSGIDDLSGIGMSSVARGEQSYFNRMVYHHYKGKGSGKFWTLFGGKPVTMNFIPMLPKNTVFCSYWKSDLAGLVDWIRSACQESGNPQFAAMLDAQLAAAKQQGIPAQKILDSSRGEFGIILTLNPETTRPFQPDPDLTLQIPDAGIAIVTRVSNTVLLDSIDRMTESNANIQREQKLGAEWRSTGVGLPIPIRLNPTLMQKGSLLVLATNKGLAESLLRVAGGDEAGLRDTAEFKAASRDIPLAASSFHYISPALGDNAKQLFAQFINQAGDDMPQAAKSMLSEFVDMYASILRSCGATVATDEGFVYSGNSAMPLGRSTTLQSSVAPLAIMAGMLLPALGQARGKAQGVACINNLKQIGLGCMMYAADNNDTLPPDLKALVADGYLDALPVYVCPASGRQPAPSADAFNARRHSSYQYFGKGLSQRQLQHPSRTVIAADRPSNHPGVINILFADGHVQRVRSSSVELAAIEQDLIIPGE